MALFHCASKGIIRHTLGDLFTCLRLSHCWLPISFRSISLSIAISLEN